MESFTPARVLTKPETLVVTERETPAQQLTPPRQLTPHEVGQLAATDLPR